MASVKGMRTGGKNRKAGALHVLQATFRRARHGQAPVPEHVPEGLPEPPKGLPEAVLHHWHVTVAFLQAMGTVSRVDGLIVEQYCRLFVETAAIAVTQSEVGASVARLEENLAGLEGAELVQCFQEITKLRQIEARYSGQIRQGRMAQRQYLIELCLTPASRARGVSRPATTAPMIDPKKQRYLDALQKPSA
jgi:phage terminase small subunit